MSLTIFCDNLIEGNWFKELSILLKTAKFSKIGSRGANPEIVDELIRYDRPDIILVDGGRPLLVVEKTQEVPTGHNVGQRIARLVRSIEMGVPTIKYFPFDAMKHGEYAGVCNLNIRILKLFKYMSEIHNVPALAVKWPCDEYYELVDDGSEDDLMRLIVNGYLESGYNHKCKEFLKAQKIMIEEYDQRLERRKAYGDPPPSVEIIETDLFLKKFNFQIDKKDAGALMRMKESLIYTIVMTPAKCRREDPYTGMQFIYDYLWCRKGPHVRDKYRNLILHFPKIKKEQWFRANPNDKNRKSCNWYLTANAFVFLDSLVLLQE